MRSVLADNNFWLGKGDVPKSVELKPSQMDEGVIINKAHLAYVGEFKGYAEDEGFSLTHETFQAFLTNFYGQKNPIPVYLGHADMNILASEEAPARGWVLGMYVEGDHLYGVIEAGEKLAEHIRSGEFRYTSIAFDPADKDRVSGEEIGPRMFSLAITNQPFLDGQEPLALSDAKQRMGKVYLSTHSEEHIMTEQQNTEQTQDNPKGLQDAAEIAEAMSPEEQAEALAGVVAAVRESKGDPELSPADALQAALEMLKPQQKADPEVAPSPAEQGASDAHEGAVGLSDLKSLVANLQKENKALSARVQAFEDAKVKAEVDAAIKRYGLSAANREIYFNIARRSMDEFKALTKDLSVVPTNNIALTGKGDAHRTDLHVDPAKQERRNKMLKAVERFAKDRGQK